MVGEFSVVISHAQLPQTENLRKRSRRDIPRGNMEVPMRAFLSRRLSKHAFTSAKVTWVWMSAPVLRGVES